MTAAAAIASHPRVVELMTADHTVVDPAAATWLPADRG
jgi:hypothetical protein